jgi:hypothetical protein
MNKSELHANILQGIKKIKNPQQYCPQAHRLVSIPGKLQGFYSIPLPLPIGPTDRFMNPSGGSMALVYIILQIRLNPQRSIWSKTGTELKTGFVLVKYPADK